EAAEAESAGVSEAVSDVVAQSVATMPVASAVRVVQFGDITRIAFDVSAPIDVRAFVMTNPDRVIVDAPETIFAIEADAGQRAAAPKRGRKSAAAKGDGSPTGLIASYRFGKLGPGRSRVVIDLARPARIVKAGAEVSEEGRLRLL